MRLDTEDVRTVERATQVAQRAEEYLKLKYPKDDKKKNEADKTKKNVGAVHNVEQTETAGGAQVNAVDKKKTKKQNQRGQNWRGSGPGRGGGRSSWQRQGPPRSFCCGGEHFFRDCPEWKGVKENCKKPEQTQQGNA